MCPWKEMSSESFYSAILGKLLTLNFLTSLTQLSQGVISVFHMNSRIHDCTFQSLAPPPPGLRPYELGLIGFISSAWSLLAHFSLDSHFHPGEWWNPNEGCKHYRLEGTPSRIQHPSGFWWPPKETRLAGRGKPSLGFQGRKES